MESDPTQPAPVPTLGPGLLLIPCYNEALSLPDLVRELREQDLDLDILMLNDGSQDETIKVARSLGLRCLDYPCNLGVAHAVQGGFQYAVHHGYDYVVRIDGDGQHPPSEIPKLLEAARRTDADVIVGSRFGGGAEMVSTRFRYLGVRGLSVFLSWICRSPVADPTSGFWLVRRPLLDYFAVEFPTDYPEPEALAVLRRQGYSFAETPVRFRVRRAGVSSIRSWGTLYYALKVGLALFVDRLRPVNRLYANRRRA